MFRHGAAGPALLVGGVIALAVAPAVLHPYHVILLGEALVASIACLSVNLLLGYAGLLPLGHAAYFGIGGYAGAFLFTFGDVNSLEVHLAIGAATAGSLAAVVGLFCTRVTGMRFGILTLAFGQVVHALFVSGAAFRPFGDKGRGFFFVGDGGLYVPRLAMAGRELEPEAFMTALYYVIAACAVGSALALHRIVRSPFGMALRAIRDSESRAWCIGLPVRRHRWTAFVVAGAFAGLAGALSAQLDRQITPQQLDWLQSAQLVVATVLGGTGGFLGPAAGAFGLVTLREVSLRLPIYHGMLLGGMLVAAVLVCPGGLVQAGTALVSSPRWMHGLRTIMRIQPRGKGG